MQKQREATEPPMQASSGEEQSISKQDLPSITTDIPEPLTSFVGREKELESARKLLLQAQVRLLTISGTGGVGKTRLALALVHEVRSYFSDGIFCISLASVNDPRQFLPAIARVPGLNLEQEQPLFTLLSDYLREKQILLLLDNLEHLLEARSEIMALLRACPQVKILVTSRAILRIQGEYEFPLLPLAVPDLKHLPSPDQFAQYSAVALFVQRVQAVKHDFVVDEQNIELVVQLCARLDGLPLAIELAVPRLKLMSLKRLAQHLDDRMSVLTGGNPDLPERQQTLQSTVTWSYDHLTASEKKLFRRLAVFVGGFTIEAVESIYRLENESPGHLLDEVTALLNKSLIQQFDPANGEPRLVMLEMFREYALKCLFEAQEETPVRERHALYYLQKLEMAEPQLHGPQQSLMLSAIYGELDNIYQAFHWFLQRHDYEKALLLVGLTGHFWILYGQCVSYAYFQEGRRFFSTALPLLKYEHISAQVRARILLYYGTLLGLLDELEQAKALGAECLELYRQLETSQGIMHAYWLLALCAEKTCAYELLGKYAEEALALATILKQDRARAFSLRYLGLAAFFAGDYPLASRYFNESLSLVRKIEDPMLLATLLRQIAEVYYAQGRFRKARHYCEESLTRAQQAASISNSAWSLLLQSCIYWQQEKGEDALRLAQQALSEHTTGDDRRGIVLTKLWLARIAAQHQQIALASVLSKDVFSFLKSEQDRWYSAVFLELLATIASLLHESRWAILLWSRARALREEIHASLSPTRRADYETARALAESELDEGDVAFLEAEGRRLNSVEVLELCCRMDALSSSASLIKEEQETRASLTRRELDVLRLLVAGQNNAQIAEQLIISKVTVNSYLRSIYSKLEVSSRTAAMRYALDHHLF